MVDAILTATEGGRAVARAVRDAGIAAPPVGPEPVQLRDVWPRHADARIHLCPPELHAEAPAGLHGYQPDPGRPEHPLALFSPATRHTIGSTFGQRRREPARLVLHPHDAASRGIGSGDAVRVWNEHGAVECLAEVSDAVRPGVAVLPKGPWSRHTRNGVTANVLAPDEPSDLSGGATFNDARVQVEHA